MSLLEYKNPPVGKEDIKFVNFMEIDLVVTARILDTEDYNVMIENFEQYSVINAHFYSHSKNAKEKLFAEIKYEHIVYIMNVRITELGNSGKLLNAPEYIREQFKTEKPTAPVNSGLPSWLKIEYENEEFSF